MQVRVVLLAVLAAAAFVVLGLRLGYLQVVAGESYDLSARATRTREVEVPAQRGVIYDRDGEVLINNVPALNITAVPAELPRPKVAELAKAVGADTGLVLDNYDAAFDAGKRGFDAFGGRREVFGGDAVEAVGGEVEEAILRPGPDAGPRTSSPGSVAGCCRPGRGRPECPRYRRR